MMQQSSTNAWLLESRRISFTHTQSAGASRHWLLVMQTHACFHTGLSSLCVVQADAAMVNMLAYVGADMCREFG